MKKILVFSLLFIMSAGIAFAQLANGIYVCAWGRGAFVPLWMDTKEYQFGNERPTTDAFTNKETFKTGTGVTWDPINKPRVDFRIMGFAQYVGFVIHVNSEFDNGIVGGGDNGAQLWVKPFGNDWVKVTLANHMIEDTLRGKVTTDSGFENFVLGASMMRLKGLGVREPLNQDVIFNRFAGGRGKFNEANEANTSTHISPEAIRSNVFFLSSAPIEGLFVGLMLQGQFPDTDIDFKETWRQMQLGAGYNIPNIGFARAQYIGGFFGGEKSSEESFRLTEPSKFEAAFAYTGTENLVIDLGLKFWTPITTFAGQTHFRGIDIGLGAAYMAELGPGKLNIAFMGQVQNIAGYTVQNAHTADNDKGKDSLKLAFNLIPSYSLDFGTLGLSFLIHTITPATGPDGNEIEATKAPSIGPFTQWGIGVFYQLGFAKGSLKVGVTYTPAPIETGIPRGETELRTGMNGRDTITIPIILEYAFF